MAFPRGGGSGITQLTGDVIAGPGTGSQAATLKAVGTAGTVGDATHYPVITTDAEGRVTDAVATAVPAGVNPATTVAGPAAYGDAAVVGTGTEYARNDHDHGLPAAPSASLSSLVSSLSADYTLTGTSAVILSTSSLAIGTWLITGVIMVDVNATASTQVSFNLGLGTASGSISPNPNGYFIPNVTASAIQIPLSIQSIVTISSAGTITLSAFILSAGGTSLIRSVGSSTYLIAVKIA